MKKILINASILVFEKPYLITKDVVIENNRITSLLDQGQYLSKSFDQEYQIFDFKDKIIAPGLINMHTHLPMKLLMGIGKGVALQEWLEKYMFPLEAKMDNEDIYHSTIIAQMEMMQNGITCFNDMYFNVEQIKQASLHTKIRSVLSMVFFDHLITKDYLENVKNAIKSNREQLISYTIGIHSFYT
ncbi:MAG: amidohydrolase family protein, partial [Bacilli bacterium]